MFPSPSDNFYRARPSSAKSRRCAAWCRGLRLLPINARRVIIIRFRGMRAIFDDLIAADGVFPDVARDVAPVSRIVKINVRGRCAERSLYLFERDAKGRGAFGQSGNFIPGIIAFNELAFGGHCHAARSGVSPTAVISKSAACSCLPSTCASAPVVQ